MKNHSALFQTILFLLIIIFFIVPPLVTIPVHADKISFPVVLIVYFIFALTVYFFLCRKNYKNPENEEDSRPEYNRKAVFIRNLGITTLTFGVILSTGMIFNILAGFFNVIDEYFLMPQSPAEYFYVILNFLFSAFYEETFYRIYIPEQLKKITEFISEKIPHKERFSKIRSFFTKHRINAAVISAEIISIIIFALSHRYRGIFAVLNAGISCITLRLCFLKTGNILTNTAAHFLYNTFSFFLSVLIASQSQQFFNS